MPKLVVVPKVQPNQGKGKPDKILHNGKSGGTIEAQIFGRRGALQNKTIVGKSLDRNQKRTVGLNAGLGTALSAGAVKRSVDYGRSSGKMKRMAKVTEAGAEKTQLLHDARYLRKMSGRNAAVVGASAGISAGLSAGIMSGQNALRDHRYRKQNVAKAMSDAELKRRRNLQSKVAITTSTLGLGALGIKSGSGVARKAGRLVRADKLSNLANTVALTSGGIGGAGGYNYAAITRAEAKKRPVSKAFKPKIKVRPGKPGAPVGPNARSHASAQFGRTTFGDNSTGKLVSAKPFDALMAGHSGVRRRPMGQFGTMVNSKNEGLGSHFGDRTVRKAFSAEANRHRRSEIGSDAARYGGAALAGGSALAAGGLAGRDAAKKHVEGNLKSHLVVGRAPIKLQRKGRDGKFHDHFMPSGRQPTKAYDLPVGSKERKAAQGTLKKINRLPGMTKGWGVKLAGLGALGVGGMVAADRIDSYGHKSGRSYSPRYHRPE